MKLILSFLLCCCFHSLMAQELFVYTEPASNMPAKSIGIRLTNTLQSINKSRYEYNMAPEIMWGISKKIMLHAETFFTNRGNNFNAEGATIYIKYRFYSNDEVHTHSRLAAFARGAFNNSVIHQPAIQPGAENSGYELGLIATKLRNKIAFSVTSSFVHATNNGNTNKFLTNGNRNAVLYSLSAGKLMLPKNYTDYRQTNVNFMTEILGQTNLSSAETYLDIAPVIQFIFLSKMRLDAGYRFSVVKKTFQDCRQWILN